MGLPGSSMMAPWADITTIFLRLLQCCTAAAGGSLPENEDLIASLRSLFVTTSLMAQA